MNSEGYKEIKRAIEHETDTTAEIYPYPKEGEDVRWLSIELRLIPCDLLNALEDQGLMYRDDALRDSDSASLRPSLRPLDGGYDRLMTFEDMNYHG